MSKNRNSGITDWFSQWQEEEREAERSQIDNAGTNKELADYLRLRYGIDVHPDFDQYDHETAKAYVQEISDLYDEFPSLRGVMTLFGRNVPGAAYAGVSLTGELSMDLSKMRTLATAETLYNRDLAQGFHPQGTSAVSIISHEIGHLLEKAVLNKEHPSFNTVLWMGHSAAQDVVSSAMDRAAPGWRSSPDTYSRMVSDISKYAAHDASETLAEAVSDYRANRGNAKPLSREIWRELKNRLG